MSPRPQRSEDRSWRRQLCTAIGCAAFGVLVHFAGPVLPVELTTVGLGIGLVGAAFLLAWAADAGEAVFSGGFLLAAIALVAVLPEFIIEIRFAYIQQTELVSANLTGATRLLLTGATARRSSSCSSRAGGARRPQPFQLAGPAGSSSECC